MVNQKEVTVMWDYSTPFTYNGQTQSINCIVTNACIRDDKSTVDNVQVVLSNNSKTNAGTYTAEATSLSNSNYKLPSTKPSKTWTIEKATLTGAWESINDFVYDGNTHYATLVISGFVNSSDASGMNTGSFTTNKIYSISTDSENRVLLKFSLKDVNTYSFTVSDVNSQNYNLNTVKTKDVKVAKRNVVVKIVENSEYTYSGLSQGKEMHLSNITSADISSFSNYLIVTGNAFYNYNTNSDGIIYYFSGVNAGDYNARITSKSTLLNYKFDTEYIAFTITPKKLEKKWSTSTGNWTDVYDGNNKTITLRIEGFVNAEKYSTNNFTVSRAATSDNSVAGVLTITFTAKDSGSYVCSVSNFNNSNYKFDDDSKTYEIKPRELEVLWSGSSSTYDGSYQGYTLKVEGFVSSDATSVKNSLLYSGNITPTVSSTSKAITYSFQATNTGTYNVKVYANSTLKNYTLTELNESFTISKRNITVDINSLSEGRVVFTNLVAGQSISSYSLKVYSDSARKNSVTDWSKDGVYYYSLAIIGADNYNLTNSNGSFEVGEL